MNIRIGLASVHLAPMVPTALIRQMRPDHVALWIFIVVTGLASSMALLGLGIVPTDSGLQGRLVLAKLILIAGGLVWWASIGLVYLAKLTSIISDFLLSYLQLLAALAALVPITYLAALPALPLVDASLVRLDGLLGFDWDVVAHWVSARPKLDWTLQVAYCSILFQFVGILFVGSLTQPGERNTEFIWTLCISFLPALGKGGQIGPYQEVLVMIRSGQWTVFDYSHTEGIITCPSFHTTVAILFTYAARRRRWALAIFGPLNVAMITSIPTVGGHYLVDLIAGAVVALGAISVTRVLRQWLQSAMWGTDLITRCKT